MRQSMRRRSSRNPAPTQQTKGARSGACVRRSLWARALFGSAASASANRMHRHRHPWVPDERDGGLHDRSRSNNSRLAIHSKRTLSVFELNYLIGPAEPFETTGTTIHGADKPFMKPESHRSPELDKTGNYHAHRRKTEGTQGQGHILVYHLLVLSNPDIHEASALSP